MKRKQKTLDTIIEEFKLNQELKGVSKSTIGMDLDAIKKFTNHCGTLDEKSVKDYLVKLKDSKVSLATKNIAISHLRVFLYWCMNEGYLNEFKINTIKGQESKIKFFTNEEVALLLQKPGNGFGEQRMYTICCLICRTGARLSTIINLKVDDIDFKEKIIIFRHLKNKKSMILPMTEALCSSLKQWVNTWELGEYLFSDKYGNQLTISNFENCFRRYCESKGVKPRGPHALRHAFARMYIKNGGDAFTLQRILTHSSMEMTRRYVELFSEDLRGSMNVYTPLDNFKSSRLIRRSV